MNKPQAFRYAPFGGEAVFQSMPDAYLVLDAALRVVLVNASYLATLHCEADSVLGRSVYDINQYGSVQQRRARREWLESIFRRLNAVQSTAQSTTQSVMSTPFAYDMPLSVDGVTTLVTRYWVMKASVVRLGDDALPYTLVRLDEVTAQVGAEQASRREIAQLRSQAQLRRVMARDAEANYLESQARFTMALEFAKLGAWDLDIATGAFACTDQCKANMGLPATAPITQQMFFRDLVDADDRGRLEETMEVALRDFLPFECDYRRTWPDGSVHWLLIKGNGRYDEHGALATIMGFTLDITARKEAEISQANIAAGERLARERSDSSAKAMDHFVAAVSHELRSPLNAILSWSTLLRRANDAKSIDRGANVIERNARQLTHMVEDLLDSGAIVTGKLSIKRELVDFGALATSVLDDIRPIAEAKGLRVMTEAVGAGRVLGDENRLKQVVWNLLTNAVKYSTQGVIGLAVTREPGTVTLTVRDSGCGIERHQLDHIFERFAQVQSENAGRVGGLGLGLWLVKTLVDLHHGQVSVESDGPGQGAVFKVILPGVDAIS